MKAIAVIGLGSPIGLDGVAQYVINQLEKKLKFFDLKNKIYVAYLDRPTIGLLDNIKKYDLVYFVDALKIESEEGQIYRYEEYEELVKSGSFISTHGIKITDLIELGSVLDSLPKKLIIYGISIGCKELHLSAKPSLSLLKACVRLARKIIEEIGN